MDSRRITTTIAGEEIELLGDRGLFWPRKKLLFVADVHLGKEETFRSHGIGLPLGSLQESLLRLQRLVSFTKATELVVLGDLIHSRQGLTQEVVSQVRAAKKSMAIPWSLVEGNHDRFLGEVAPIWELGLRGPSWQVGPFEFAHEPFSPSEARGLHRVAGHLHPTVLLSGGGDRLRLPCFCIDNDQTLLPAFTTFSNGLIQKKRPHRRLYVVADEQVIPL